MEYSDGITFMNDDEIVELIYFSLRFVLFNTILINLLSIYDLQILQKYYYL